MYDCISNPKSEILDWTALRAASAVQFEISDFGFEMQDSSNFKFSLRLTGDPEGGGRTRILLFVSFRTALVTDRPEEKHMFKRFILSLIAIVLVAGLLHAHGDPILGTVTAVTNDTFTITDKENKTVVIMLEKNTKFLMNDKPAKKTDLKTGVRVVIDAHMDTKMKMYAAEEVNIGTAAAKGTK
jgi:hypothetical protein